MADEDRPGIGALAFLVELPRADGDFRADVLAGLRAEPRGIPPKYFYDRAGAKLFEAICETPEYYVTRAETALLTAIAPEIAALAGPGASLIEPGSGAAEKARILLAEMASPTEYILFDISREQLERTAAEVAEAFPGLRIGAVAGDFTVAAPNPGEVFQGGGRRICFFPGGTLGNFDPDAQADLLRRFKTFLRPGDALLVGVDTIKDAARLDAAYNDVAGHTAAFNLNLLHRIAAELDAELDPGDFRHLAFFRPSLARIEMHLVARRSTRIKLAGETFDFTAGEGIHTENSWKFDAHRLAALATRAGFTLERTWMAAEDAFMVAWLAA